jgi:murein DD-endopeptidase MepM/ murein hydrolase activator NlpD
MPRWPSLSLAAALLLAAVPATASAQTGGAAAPEGGAPVPTRFTVAPRTIRPGQGPVQFTYRIDGRPRRRVRVRIDLVASGARRPAARLELGEQPTGRTLLYRWTPGALPAGRYSVRLHAVDKAGRPLRRTARASGRSSVRVEEPPPVNASGPGVFPVSGPWSIGGSEARFGAVRAGHVHQGQDVPAAEGTPLVAPQAGSVTWSSYQAAGAGYYLVIRSAGTARDLVFMHLREGSMLVAPGAAVAAGQAIGQVGQTGDADGPHLHFEIWPAGWKAGQPIDPLGDLLAWAGLAAPPA